MDDVHGTHGTTSVVKDPFLLDVDVLGVLLAKLIHNVLHNSPGVLSVLGDRSLRQIVEVLEVEDVELLEVLLDKVDDGAQERGEEAENQEELAEAAALRLGTRRGLGGLGLALCHCCDSLPS